MKFWQSFLLFVLISLPTHAEIIRSINISGLDSVSRGTVLNYLPIEINDDYSLDSSNSIIRSLYATNLFKNIKVNFINGVVNIEIIENPTIKFFDFLNFDEGNNVLDEDKIEDIKNLFKLNVGDIFSDRNLQNLISELSNLYQKEGFYNIKITKKIDIDSKNRVGIELDIEENNPVRISKFSVSGNSFYSEEFIKDQFEIGEPDFILLNYFTDKDLFNDISFNAGIEKIKKYYLDNGFLDIRISSDNFIFKENNEFIDIGITISEGNQYKFGNIKFIGELEGVDEALLKSYFQIEKGKYVDRKKIIDGVKKVGTLYRNNGFAYSEVTSNLEPSANPKELDLKIQVDLGYRYLINRIVISGNTKTQDDVIRRQLSILEREMYSLKDIDNSIDKIRRLGYFSNVNKRIEKVSATETLVDLFIEVVESKTGEISLGLSHSNSTGASINAGISQNNVFGTGNTLNAKFTNSKAIEELSFYFKDPYFNKDAHTISYGYFDRYTDASGLDISSYILNENGFSFGYGIPISAYSNIAASSLISFTDLKCGSLIASSSYEADQCSEDNDLDFKISAEYSHNSLNDFYFPSDGSKNSLKFSLGLPIGDFKYWSLEGSHKKYITIHDNLVFKSSARANFATGYGGDTLPFYKRYYEGGSSSVRGFDFNSIGPKYLNGNAKGGESSLVSTIAISSPLSNIANVDSRNLRLIGFIDVGTITEKFNDVNFLDEARASTGIQFTWLSPIGPISIYGAKPLLSKSNDDTKTFSFELGAAF